MRDINKKFSVRYYLNLVLIDEEERRYFKQQVRDGAALLGLCMIDWDAFTRTCWECGIHHWEDGLEECPCRVRCVWW